MDDDDFSRPFFPIFFHLNIVWSLWNLVHMFYVWIPRRLFFHFFEIRPRSPPGGESPPKIPPLEKPSDCLEIWYLCSVPRYLTNACFSFPKFPPIPPPRGGTSPRNFKISKFTLIVLKFGMYVLWHIPRIRVLSVFRNSPRSPPGGEIPTPQIPPSWNIVRLPWNSVCMLCTPLLNECPLQFSEIPPIRPPGGDFPPKIPKSRNLVRLSWNLVCMYSGTSLEDVFRPFSKIPSRSPPGGEIPPQIPPSWNIIRLPWNSVCMLCTPLLYECFCSVFRSSPYSPPRGGDFPRKIPKSRNLVRLSWNFVCMYSGTLLEDEFCPFSETPPQFPPLGGGPTPKFIIFKYCWIVLAFGMCVLYHNIKRLIHFFR